MSHLPYLFFSHLKIYVCWITWNWSTMALLLTFFHQWTHYSHQNFIILCAPISYVYKNYNIVSSFKVEYSAPIFFLGVSFNFLWLITFDISIVSPLLAMKERSRQVMGKVNRELICQIIYLETVKSGVSIRISIENAIHPKWLKWRDLCEGVTYRVMDGDIEAPRDW